MVTIFRTVVASPLAQDQLLLTKGDNNPVDDLELYNGLEWLERKHIVGKVRGYVYAFGVCSYLLIASS
jgi:signal peptidase